MPSEERGVSIPGMASRLLSPGLAIIWLAIASPLDGFADALLSAHMVEHLLLMSFVPPLLLLGYPVVPLLRGLPRGVPFTCSGLHPHNGFAPRPLLVTPLVAWLAMNLVFLAWHMPAAYDFALEHEHWHEFEHACFLGTSILFWWPLIRPWPTRALCRMVHAAVPGRGRHRQHGALRLPRLL